MRVGSKCQYNFYFGAAARLTLFFAANFLFFLLLQCSSAFALLQFFLF
jgi:hypothetical protein